MSRPSSSTNCMRYPFPARRGLPILPANRVSGTAQALFNTHGLKHFASRAAIAFLDDIAQTQFEWIDAQILGNHVHLRLGCEIRHWPRRRTERATRHFGGVDRQAFEIEIGRAIWADEALERHRAGARPRARIGAAIDNDTTLPRKDASILSDARLE